MAYFNLNPLGQGVRRGLRPLLLKLLSWTEKEGKSSRVALFPFQREAHIPLWITALAVWSALFLSLYFKAGPSLGKVVGILLLTSILLGLFIAYLRIDSPDFLKDPDGVALLGVLAVAGALLMEFWFELSQLYPSVSPFGVPLAAFSLLAALLLKPRLGAVLNVALSLFLGVIYGFSMEEALVVCIGGLTGVMRGLSVRNRLDVTRAGLWIAVAQAAGVTILWLLQNWTAQYFFFSLRWALMGGVFSALIALGLLPYLESFFSRLTNIKLLELTDVNHPLLKRMSLEAPGTYHHSLIMASLAQSAAESVGANGLLCRVGAYFHDIGKMVKPEYFVENQGALGNPHDPLPPSMSRLVIQSHVKEGLVLARQHRLDKAIADFIVMHHGTSRIEYFYRRAVERSTGLEEVGEDEYRYPGPKPHSRETAILMMADSVEASVRALENPTHQRIQDQVKKIINAKMEDGQFDEVPLTLSDIHKISDSFVNTLIGVYHSRIKYPEASEASAAEAK